jgi:hypothetical protein
MPRSGIKHSGQAQRKRASSSAGSRRLTGASKVLGSNIGYELLVGYTRLGNL